MDNTSRNIPLWKRAARRIRQAGLPVPALIRPVVRAAYRLGVAAQETMPWFKKILWIEPVMRSVCAEMGVRFRADRMPYLRGRGRLLLGDDVNLSGRSCFYFMNHSAGVAEIRIGNNVFIGNGCTFSAAQRISVGNNCLIAPGVRIHDNDGHPLDAVRRAAGERMGPENIGEVIIGDGVWIAAQAVVLKGVTIGARSVVGAGAVVTENVPEDCIVAGNPAHVVRRLPANRENALPV